MREIIKLARPHQWIKNVFCLAGVFFGGHFLEWPFVFKALLVFAGFCALSSAVYIFNDVHDRESDRLHPQKKNRPLVKGTVKVSTALFIAALALIAGFAIFTFLGSEFPSVAAVAGIYVALNVAYTLRLKHMPLLDVNVIAVGFVLRVAAGAFGIAIEPTRWILLCTYFLALLVAFGKRRAELFVAIEGDAATGEKGSVNNRRKALEGYTLEVLDIGLVVCAVLVIASYSFYCVFSHEDVLIVATVIPVVVGALRYLTLAREGVVAETPELIVMRDRLIQIDFLVWAALFGYVLYGS